MAVAGATMTALTALTALTAMVASFAVAAPASAGTRDALSPTAAPATAPSSAASDPHGTTTYVVVPTGGLNAAAAAVRAVSGTVTATLAGVSQLVASLTPAAASELRRSSAVRLVSADASVHMSGQNYDQAYDPGAPQLVTGATGARTMWSRGYTGRGVDVAVLDTGVVAVNGLDLPGKVVVGPDLSFDSQDNDLSGRDTFGHGTHISGIIAGRDSGIDDINHPTNDKYFGMAPDARIVSVKLGDISGAVDVTQVLAGIDWVVQHRRDNGLNIRVLNLSFGTDSAQSYQSDPLAYAAEVAWRYGIVVVAAAGNAGTASNPNAPGLTDPAYDPTVIAVGASDMHSTLSTSDDTVPAFSSRGANGRDPDFVAPGRSIIGLRDYGSAIDVAYSDVAEVGNRFFRGSGTSQAAGVVSGAVALLLQQNPSLTPDQVKALLKATAHPLATTATNAQGSGSIDVAAAGSRGLAGLSVPTPAYAGTGLGTLQAARGTNVLEIDGVTLKGEQSIFGTYINSGDMARAENGGAVWWGGVFSGDTYTGADWNGTSTAWQGRSWSGVQWSGRSWSGRSWSGRSWSGRSWSNGQWSGWGWGNGPRGDADAWSSASWGK